MYFCVSTHLCVFPYILCHLFLVSGVVLSGPFHFLLKLLNKLLRYCPPERGYNPRALAKDYHMYRWTNMI